MADQHVEDQMYMAMARIAAERSHDPKAGVGCVIVADHQITIGWNGTPENMPNQTREPHLHRTEFGLYLKMRTKPTVLHAEWNALSKFTASTASAAGGTLYTTMGCCFVCAVMSYRAKIARVVYEEPYRDPRGMEFLADRGVKVVKLR